MHWLLVRALRATCALPQRADVERVLDEHLTPASIAARGRVPRSGRARSRSSGRTAGRGCSRSPRAARRPRRVDPRPRALASALAPLTRAIVERFLEFLPRAALSGPLRHARQQRVRRCCCALDYARAWRERSAAKTRDAQRRTRGSRADRDLPAAWEPSGADFLSPSLVEARPDARACSSRTRSPTGSRGALPGLADGVPTRCSRRSTVSDRSDPQIVHLDGLNLSRAWCLRGIAAALPRRRPRAGPRCSPAPTRHLAAGLAGLDSGDYVGAHWLATFAVLALSARDRARAAARLAA